MGPGGDGETGRRWTGPTEEIGDDLADAAGDSAGEPADSTAESEQEAVSDDVPPPHQARGRMRRFKAAAAWAAAVTAIFGTVAIPLTPSGVNGIAYLAGLERTATFTAVAYSQACDGDGGACGPQTDGPLSGGGWVTWDGEVPLGRSFPVHAPVLDWGTGRDVITSSGAAVAAAAFGFVGSFWFWVLLYFAVGPAAKAARRRMM